MGEICREIGDISDLARGDRGDFGDNTYNQIADKDLKNLSLKTCAAGKDLLENADKKVAEGRADEHAIQRHLRDARAEIVAVLADIVGDP